jgi:hypothetical protein
MTLQEPSLFVDLEQVLEPMGLVVVGGSLWDNKFEMGFFFKLLKWKVFVTIMFNAQQSFNVENEFMGKTHQSIFLL